jgi:DnaJ-class molecular chaperone
MVNKGEKKPEVCGTCHGSGYQAMGCNLFPCPDCDGKGVAEYGGDGVQAKKQQYKNIL